MEFREALKLSNEDFAVYTREKRREWKAKMLSDGMVYFPAIDRWYPIGTKIRGIEIGEFIP